MEAAIESGSAMGVELKSLFRGSIKIRDTKEIRPRG